MKRLYTATVIAATLLATGVDAQNQKATSPLRATIVQSAVKERTPQGRTALMAAKGIERLPHHGGADASRGGVVNDDCATAQVITLIAPDDCATAAIVGNNSAASNGAEQPGCDDPSDAGYQDVWYTFNSGAYTSSNITLTPDDVTTQDWGLVVYDACGGNEVYCEITPSGPVTVALNPGTDYYVRVYSNLDWGVGGPFTLCASYVIATDAPANDECADAVALTVGATCSPTSATLAGATESMPAATCSDFVASVANDVWFSFVGTGNPVVVEASGLGVTDGVDPSLEVLEGSCGSLSSLGCVDATVIGSTEAMNIPTVLGQSYYARVYSWPYTTPPNSFDFSICVYDAPPPPANDGCVATPEALSVGSTLSFTGTTVGATSDGDFVAGSELDGADPTVWHAFTTTECTEVTISYCGTNPVFENIWIFLAPSCPAGDDYILATDYEFTSCAEGNATLVFELLPAGTYYLPVQQNFAGANGPYTLTVSAVACPAPLANDECAGAVMLTSANTCNSVAGTTAGATQSMDPILCNEFTSPSANDVWYSFTATTANDSIIVEGIDMFDAVIEFFSGDCGSLVSMSCEDSTFPQDTPATERMFVSGLSEGSTYYFRVYDYDDGSDLHTFNVCVKSDGTIGIAEPASTSFSIHPNPTQGDLTIQGADLNGTVNFELTDMTGRVVYKDQMSMISGQSVTLPLNGKLAQGTYSLRVITANGISSRAVMVK